MGKVQKNNGNNYNKSAVKTVGHYLASALDMEDQISNGVYQEYLDLNNWPADLETDKIEMVREYLTILIKDTEKHKNMFLDLNKRLSDDVSANN